MTDTPHILIIDDDLQIRELLQSFLQQQGWLTSTAKDANDAREVLRTIKPDLILLDVMMPGETGIELLKSIRKNDDIAVIMLTAKTELDDKVEGLLAGADDYLTKPFEPEELILRIKAILRRIRPDIDAPTKIVIGTIEYDCERGVLSRNNKVLKLTEGEGALLTVLSSNPGTVFSREELTLKAKIDGGDRAVDVQITRLRKKLEDDSKKPHFVQTVRGKGYVLRV